MTVNDFRRTIHNFGMTLEVTRFQSPTIVKGRVQAPVVDSTFEICGSIQPMTPKDLQLLPEGSRVEGLKKLYTDAELKTLEDPGGSDMPDRIEYRDVVYKVDRTSDWHDHGCYHKYVLVRIDR
jgi:hypothetical protein